MDYNGFLEFAEPNIEVNLFDPTWLKENKENFLAWNLLKNQKQKWKSVKDIYNYMISCSNNQFEASSIQINFNETDLIRMNVKKNLK